MSQMQELARADSIRLLSSWCAPAERLPASVDCDGERNSNYDTKTGPRNYYRDVSLRDVA